MPTIETVRTSVKLLRSHPAAHGAFGTSSSYRSPGGTRVGLIGAVLLLLSGCADGPAGEQTAGDEAAALGSAPAGFTTAAPGEEAAQELPKSYVICVEPRPQVCTREYRPVCALRGEHPGTGEWVTKSNACDACADPELSGHRPGACDAEGPLPQTMLDY